MDTIYVIVNHDGTPLMSFQEKDDAVLSARALICSYMDDKEIQRYVKSIQYVESNDDKRYTQKDIEEAVIRGYESGIRVGRSAVLRDQNDDADDDDENESA